MPRDIHSKNSGADPCRVKAKREGTSIKSVTLVGTIIKGGCQPPLISSGILSLLFLGKEI